MEEARQRELLDAIFAAPDEDEPRHVYADWLIEQGDRRGELIAVQCELAALPPSAPGRAELEKRSQKLLAAYRAGWTLGIRGLEFVRGFVETVRMPLEDAGRHRALFEREPVRSLTVVGGGSYGAVCRALLGFRLDALRELEVEPERRAAIAGLDELLRRPALGKLARLTLGTTAVDEDVATALAESAALERLETLAVFTGKPTISRAVADRLRSRFGSRLTLR